MSGQRQYRTFLHKEAGFRIACANFEQTTAEIVRQRAVLGTYIARDPRFRTALRPVPISSDAPPIVCHMAAAAQAAGVGPMAAVAGAVAQFAAEAGTGESIVENGGDIYCILSRPLMIGLHPGGKTLSGKLAFRVAPDDTPLALCSSSGRMGDSDSFGDCDLATVLARDGALADAAATRAANLVRQSSDIDAALETVHAIPGVDGVLIVKDERIGLVGTLPPLVGQE